MEENHEMLFNIAGVSAEIWTAILSKTGWSVIAWIYLFGGFIILEFPVHIIVDLSYFYVSVFSNIITRAWPEMRIFYKF